MLVLILIRDSNKLSIKMEEYRIIRKEAEQKKVNFHNGGFHCVEGVKKNEAYYE